MEESSIIVLYKNKEEDSLHKILLSDIELGFIEQMISDTFRAKGNDSVLVGFDKYKLVPKKDIDEKQKNNSSNI